MGCCLQCDADADDGELCLFHEILSEFPPIEPRGLYVRSDARRLIDQARAHRYIVKRGAARRLATSARRAGRLCLDCAGEIPTKMTGRMPKRCPSCSARARGRHQSKPPSPSP